MSQFKINGEGEIVRGMQPAKATPADLCEEILLRIKPKTDAEMQAYESDLKKREYFMQIGQLTHEAKAPLRQWRVESLDRTGEWGKVEAKLLKALGKGFLSALTGVRGNGKTQMAVELMRKSLSDLKPTRYCSATEFFTDVKATYGQRATESERDVIRRYRNPALLIVDEAGQRAETEWENRLLFELLNKRYADVKDTLLISNQERVDFEKSIGPSLVSRMNETGGILSCNWPSFRE